jgi:hypothetical protein
VVGDDQLRLGFAQLLEAPHADVGQSDELHVGEKRAEAAVNQALRAALALVRSSGQHAQQRKREGGERERRDTEQRERRARRADAPQPLQGSVHAGDRITFAAGPRPPREDSEPRECAAVSRLLTPLRPRCN